MGHDRLEPWANFVPIAPDMSDLVDKIRWLREHDQTAQVIGERGRALAISMDYEAEVRQACRTISSALRYFACRQEDLTLSPPVSAPREISASPRGLVDFQSANRKLATMPGPLRHLHPLVTHHHAVVFFDVGRDELRHGPAASSPRNTFLMLIEGATTGHLVYAAADGALSTIGVGAGMNAALVQLRDLTPDSSPAWSTASTGGRAIGLLSDGLYLCAEPDGRVTLSRQHFGPWEQFSLAEEQGLGLGGLLTTLTLAPSKPLVAKVEAALKAALVNNGKVPAELLGLEGMSGQKYRLFINNLIGSIESASYLEVGVWMGSTLCSAIHGNKVRAVAIDNWSQFGGPTSQFLANLSRFKTAEASVSFLESDFRAVNFGALGRFNVYLFDGPHRSQDQRDGLVLALPALDNFCVFIVDDWNWEQVRQGTMAVIREAGMTVDYMAEIRTTLDGKHAPVSGSRSDWHNGYFISVLSKDKKSG